MNLQAKAIAVDQVFRPARDIVEATVSDTVQDRFVAPKTSNIKRYVNNYRTAFRPKDPTDLDFEVNYLFMIFMLHIELNHLIRNYLLFQCLTYMYFYFLQINMSPVRRIPESWPPCWRGGHLIFSTEHQLNILRQAKKWYIDGTFKVLWTGRKFNNIFIFMKKRCSD